MEEGDDVLHVKTSLQECKGLCAKTACRGQEETAGPDSQRGFGRGSLSELELGFVALAPSLGAGGLSPLFWTFTFRKFECIKQAYASNTFSMSSSSQARCHSFTYCEDTNCSIYLSVSLSLSMYVCMYIYIYILIYISMCVYMCVYIYIHIYTYMHTQTYT